MSIIPLNIKTKLAKTPSSKARYGVEVTNIKGDKDTLGDPKTTRVLVALMNQHAVTGGAAAHWGGPAAFAEIMSSIHGIMFRPNEKQWYEQYNFVNDAGHTENGVYALRANLGFDDLNFEALRGFRSIDSKLTGHGEAHLNPEGVLISNGPLGSGLPQAQGLAMADKLIKNNRVTICTLSDGGSMEGEAKEAFASIPGLAAKGKMNPFLLVISDNNTKLSGRIEGDSFDMSPTFASLPTLGWETIFEEDGHNLETVHAQIERALEKAKSNPEKPVCLVVKTIKGYGVKSTEESLSGGHGYPLKPYDQNLCAFLNEIYAGNCPQEFLDWAENVIAKKPDSPKKEETTIKHEKVQPGFSRALIRAAKEGLPVFSISADLQGSTGVAAFHKEFPDRFIDIGIAESNMINAAIGLSKQGLIPIVDTFAQFGITKGNLPLTMANLSGGPVIGLFSHIGFQDAADGASHQATTYLAATSSIPDTTVISVSCSKEAESYMYQTIKYFEQEYKEGRTPNSVLFFYGRENHPEYYNEKLSYDWEKAQILKEGSDLLIVSAGPMVPKALAAAKELKEQGISASVINNPFTNRIDIETISGLLKKSSSKLITIEDHQIVGGMGAQLSHSLLLAGHQFEVTSLGNPGKFGQSAYKADHLYKLYEQDTDDLVKAALKMTKK